MGVADVDPSQMSLMARTLRVAAAIYSVLPTAGQKGADVVESEFDIRSFIIASIHIGRDLFDSKLVKDNWNKKHKEPLQEVGSAARDMQNELVKEVVKLDLASSELRTILMGRSAILQPSPAQAPKSAHLLWQQVISPLGNQRPSSSSACLKWG